jgi:hypothetical protein
VIFARLFRRCSGAACASSSSPAAFLVNVELHGALVHKAILSLIWAHLNPSARMRISTFDRRCLEGSERAPGHSAKAKRPDCPAKVDFTS